MRGRGIGVSLSRTLHHNCIAWPSWRGALAAPLPGASEHFLVYQKVALATVGNSQQGDNLS